MMPVPTAAALLICLSPVAQDGDNVRCNGRNMRVEGINARELDGTCRGRAPCPAMSGPDAKAVMTGLIADGATYRIQYLDRYDRPVVEVRLADGRDLACALIAEGAAARWEDYWPNGKTCPAS